MALPALAPVIGGILLYITTGVVFRALAALGIGYMTYTGINALLAYIKNEMLSAFGSLPPQIFQLLGYMQVGTAFNIILSACVIRLTLRGLNTASGAITVWLLSSDHL
ncbi:DUF2523 domain-containing protein [Vandammella animalimorsus]|uniref:DUF2523 domain-containing protein n=1 Tax=Vandammella animalimorsus TaxID=2029117 RepID=A0A3M6R1A3_9BURK|nr:DUF2523 domain-containing protein [Vandammella animalimorsus]RMX09035.1 DUF2523 domain-containing protein [Vandammella animalimorsus]RMX09046.1 DUF2523 domain-containing protein [Vandammella animalimorsus]